MKKLCFLPILLVSIPAVASVCVTGVLRTIYNPYTNKLDYVCDGSGGGGGSSTGTVVLGGTGINVAVNGSSYTVNLAPNSTNYIQNNQTSTPQNATFYVTSGTINGLFTVSTNSANLSGSQANMTLQTSTSAEVAGGTPMMVLVDTEPASSTAEMDWNWLFNSGVGSLPALYARETVYSQGITPTINGDIGWAVKVNGATTEIMRLLGVSSKLRVPNFQISNLASNVLKADSSGNVYAAQISPSTDVANGTLPVGVVASSITNTAVTPGSYTNTNLTVGADGRLTAASNGTAGSGSSITTATGTPAGFTSNFSTQTTVFNFNSTNFTGLETNTTFYIALTNNLPGGSTSYMGSGSNITGGSTSYAQISPASPPQTGPINLTTGTVQILVSNNVNVNDNLTQTSTISLTISVSSNQVTDMTEWKNNGTVIASVTAGGNIGELYGITAGTMTANTSVETVTLYISTVTGLKSSNETYNSTNFEQVTSTSLNVGGYGKFNGGVALSTISYGLAGNLSSTNTSVGNLQWNTGLVANAFQINAATNSIGMNVQVNVSSSLSVGQSLMISTNNVYQVGTSTTMAFTNNGHLEFHSSTSPTVSSCGTGTPSVGVNSTDSSGNVTTGTAATACTITFSLPFKNAPNCQVSGSSLVSFPGISSVANTSITFGISGAVTGDILYWNCTGVQ